MEFRSGPILLVGRNLEQREIDGEKKNQWCNLPIEGDGCQSGRTGYRYLKSINKKEN